MLKGEIVVLLVFLCGGEGGGMGMSSVQSAPVAIVIPQKSIMLDKTKAKKYPAS